MDGDLALPLHNKYVQNNWQDFDMTHAMLKADIFDIFYDEAKRITRSEKEAKVLTDDAVSEFMSHYSKLRSRSGNSAKSGFGEV